MVTNSFIRFGKTLFFEQPITNPFGHEERFLLSLEDPELRLVTAFDEWLHLRRHTRPCVGDLGSEPVEAEMFDRDGYGNVQVALLPHETLHLPLTFMTLSLLSASSRTRKGRSRGGRLGPAKRPGGEGKTDDRYSKGDSKQNDGQHDNYDDNEGEGEEDEVAGRIAEVRVVSCTHGHVVAVIRIHICPRPPVVHRTLRFFESENGLMRRRIQLKTNPGSGTSYYPGAPTSANKFVHCVEMENNAIISTDPSSSKSQSRVVVEWGPSGVNGSSSGALDILLRYRCGPFPSNGSFFLLVYDDPYQSELHQVCDIDVDVLFFSFFPSFLSYLVAFGDDYPLSSFLCPTVTLFFSSLLPSLPFFPFSAFLFPFLPASISLTLPSSFPFTLLLSLSPDFLCHLPFSSPLILQKDLACRRSVETESGDALLTGDFEYPGSASQRGQVRT